MPPERSPLTLGERYDPENLYQEGLQFLKNNRPKRYQELRDSGRLDEHLNQAVASTRELMKEKVAQLLQEGWNQPAAENRAYLLVSPEWLFPGMPSIA